MRRYFCTKCCSFVWHTMLHKYVASCCIYMMCATQHWWNKLSRTIFKIDQKEWLGKHCTSLTRTAGYQTAQTWTPSTIYHVWGAICHLTLTSEESDREGTFDWGQVTGDTWPGVNDHRRRGVMVGRRTVAIKQHFYWHLFKLLLLHLIKRQIIFFYDLMLNVE